MLQHWASESKFYTGEVFCTTSLSRLRLHVDVFVLNFNESVKRLCVATMGQSDVRLNYIYIIIYLLYNII